MNVSRNIVSRLALAAIPGRAPALSSTLNLRSNTKLTKLVCGLALLGAAASAPAQSSSPSATTLAATGIFNDSATLNASINPGGLADAWFQYSTTANLSGPTVSTLAGSTAGYLNGTGTGAQFSNPYGVAVDASGNVYVADYNNNRIRKVTRLGVVTTLAGSTQGNLDGTGALAQFNNPAGVAVDASGNVYVADMLNSRIRKVTSDGVVTTLAGSTDGFANGTGTGAKFYYPTGVAVDASGNVYVADIGNARIRKVTALGVVTTFAGSSYGYLDGTGTGAKFAGPSGVAVDASGNVYVGDQYNRRVRKVTAEGVVTTLAGSGAYGSANGTGVEASFNGLFGVAVDASGNVYVADAGNALIRQVTAAGVVTTLAGSGLPTGNANGAAATAKFNNPLGVAVDASGNVYVADSSNERIRKVTAGGVVTSILAQSGLAGASSVNVSLSVPGLVAQTTYYYRAQAINSLGTNTGQTLSFTTKYANTTLTLASSLNPAPYGSSVTLTATVSTNTATGSVTFKDGATTLGTGTLSSGVATFTTGGLSGGSHSLTTEYAGDTSYSGSTSSPLSQTVDKATPTVNTWPTASAITAGQALSASTLSGGGATVAGAFTFDSPTTTPPEGAYSAAVTFTPTAAINYATVSGSVSVTVNPAGPATRTAVNDGPWNDPDTWGGTLPAAGEDVVIPLGKTVTLDGNTTAIRNLTLAGTLTVLGASTSTLQMSGNFNNTGTFTPGTGTVELTGGVDQTLAATAPSTLTFYKLTVNKNPATATVTATSKLKASKKLTITKGKLISASDYGDVFIDTDGTLDLSNDITVSGNFTNNGTFNNNDNGVTFDGGVEQNLSLADTTWFSRLTVTAGTTLIETETGDYVQVAQLSNLGVIRKTQAVDTALDYYFGLAGNYGAGLEIDVTSLAGAAPLTAIQVDRVDSNPPNAPGTNVTAIYWTITAVGSDFTATVILPQDGLADPQVCRYRDSAWDWARSSFTPTTVTRTGLTAFGEFAVFNDQHIPPTSANTAGSTVSGHPLVLSLAKLLARASATGPGNILTIPAAGPTSVNGPVNNVVLDSIAGTITYTPANGYVGTDTFTYTVRDSFELTVTPTVTVTVTSANVGSPNVVSGPTYSGGSFRVTFAGIPGTEYTIQTATSLTGPWSYLKKATAGAKGLFEVIDSPAPSDPARYYRTVYP